jgi:hypothetical protein
MLFFHDRSYWKWKNSEKNTHVRESEKNKQTVVFAHWDDYVEKAHDTCIHHTFVWYYTIKTCISNRFTFCHWKTSCACVNSEKLCKSVDSNTWYTFVFSVFHSYTSDCCNIMSSIVDGLNSSIFKDFAFYAVGSVLKMMAMSLLTSRQRLSKSVRLFVVSLFWSLVQLTFQVFANPEDVTLTRNREAKVTLSDPIVERIRRNHLNDIENIIPFVIIGWFYVCINPSSTMALWHFRTFFFSRIFHTIAYQVNYCTCCDICLWLPYNLDGIAATITSTWLYLGLWNDSFNGFSSVTHFNELIWKLNE